MFRFLTFTALIAGALLFTIGTAKAQDQDLPVAGPDEVIYYGEAPGAPGTEVWAEYLVGAGPEIAVCGRTTTAEDTSFVLVVDADCAGNLLGPLICWGEGGPDSCKGHPRSGLPDADDPERGDSVDLGLLEPTEAKLIGVQPDGAVGIIPSTGADIPVQPEGTVGELPETGAFTPAGPASGAAWPFWIAGALIAIAVVGAGSSLAIRLRS